MHDMQSKDSSRSEHGNGLGALTRLGWIAVGPVVMLGMGMSIASLPAWSFGVRDLVFWGVAVLVGVLRYVDIVTLDGQNSYGQPATKTDLRRYLVGLALVVSVVWLGAQTAGS